MYNTLNSVFSDALKREGKVITAYSDNTPYNVIFKRNSDTNSLTNRLSIFYSVNCGIHAGQLLTYKGKHYLTLNQESAENDTYYKSDLIETNAVIQTIANSTEINMPIYAYDIADGLTNKGNIISLIGGNIHVIAEPNSIVKSMEIDDYFNSMGRFWKIDNIILKDNVIHFYCEVDVDVKHEYTITISGNDTYHHGETAQLTAIAKQDNTIVNNVSFDWSSSNTSLATVDSTGLVKFIADGNVTITATWKTQNISGTKEIAITEPDLYSLSDIVCDDTYTTADTPTLTVNAQKNGITDSSATITWTSSDTSIATIDSIGKITFLNAGNVTFTATWTQQNLTSTKEITVTKSASMTCTITYKGSATIKTGGSAKPFNAHFWNGSTELTDQKAVWTVIPPVGFENDIIKIENLNGKINTVGIQAEDNEDLIGKTLLLKLEDANHVCSATLTVNIVSLFG